MPTIERSLDRNSFLNVAVRFKSDHWLFYGVASRCRVCNKNKVSYHYGSGTMASYYDAKDRCALFGAKLVDEDKADQVRLGCHIIDFAHYHPEIQILLYGEGGHFSWDAMTVLFSMTPAL